MALGVVVGVVVVVEAYMQLGMVEVEGVVGQRMVLGRLVVVVVVASLDKGVGMVVEVVVVEGVVVVVVGMEVHKVQEVGEVACKEQGIALA